MTILRTFHHPDHLGSSSWITDNTGRPIQHLHYLPFGEDWVDQRNSSWNAPYTFSGKEKDVETGYCYFGARYYDSGLSIWLSVDPMSDKYPSMSPYNYCANNPIILVDPDGRKIIPTSQLLVNPSMNAILTTTQQNSVFNKVMKAYNTSANIYIHLEQLKRNGIPTGKGNMGKTEPFYVSTNPVSKYGMNRIILNTDVLNNNGGYTGDKTFMFNTLLHEAIHAKMLNILQVDPSFKNHPGYKFFGSHTPDGHHEQMALYDRKTLIEGMMEFDQQMGTSHSDEWYEAISWVGLTRTKAWEKFMKDNPEKAENYISIIRSEISKTGGTNE